MLCFPTCEGFQETYGENTAWLVLVPFGLALAVAGAAQRILKCWMQWTLQDAQKILDDSAWGQTQINTENTVSTPGAIEVQRVNLRVRFLSAKPIRQALLRILELSPGKAPTPAQIEGDVGPHGPEI